MKNKLQKTGNDLRAEYDFDYSKAIRGKYYQRLSKEGANVVVLEPDIAKVFRDSAAVNDVLRSLLELTRSTRREIKRSRGRATKTAVRRSI
jgi:arginine deiminase